MVFGALNVVGVCVLRCNDVEASLPEADSPPLEYAYLSAPRIADYLGQAQDGLAQTEQRTKQLSDSVNASVSAGTAAQLGVSKQDQEGTTATVTPTAADDMYEFLRLLRKEGEASYTESSTCKNGKPGSWLGKINDQASVDEIMSEVNCVGVGNFVRIVNAQLFLPPYAQALQKAQSVNAFYGPLPSERTPFTSPAQSVALRTPLLRYEKDLGKNPRLPFVAAPYGSTEKVGEGVTFFLPAEYSGFKSEPSLLSGSLTIVGKIVYYARAGTAYIDYPTVSTFGKALGETASSFATDIGVCSKTPPPAIRSHPPSGSGSADGQCADPEQALKEVKKSVSFKTPIVVVLPLAIYQ